MGTNCNHGVQGIGNVADISGGNVIGKIDIKFDLPDKIKGIKNYDDAIVRVFNNFLEKDNKKSQLDIYFIFVIVFLFVSACWSLLYITIPIPWHRKAPLFISVLFCICFGIFKSKEWRMLSFEIKCHKQLISDLLREKALDEIIKAEKSLIGQNDSGLADANMG